MRRQAAAQQQLVFIIIGRDAALQLRAIALEQPPFRHLDLLEPRQRVWILYSSV